MQWSDTVADYYPVNPVPRWGFGRPTNQRLRAVLEQGRVQYGDSLGTIERQRHLLHQIPMGWNPSAPLKPFWSNPWFSTLDAAALVSFLMARAPTRYLEIGSGYSSLFARYAINAGSLTTTLTSIDPNPRADIDQICDRVLRRPLEDCELTLFDELQSGDILFFDGSHRVFTNSDVTVFFLEILPRLHPGVLVHVHDIFLPDDYPPGWSTRLYSEQYLLGAMLLARPQFRVIFPNYFVFSDAAFRQRIDRVFAGDAGAPAIPALYPNENNTPPVSFWIETVAAN